MDDLLHAQEMLPQLIRTGNSFDISISGVSDCLFGYNIPRHGPVQYYITAMYTFMCMRIVYFVVFGDIFVLLLYGDVLLLGNMHSAYAEHL